MSGHETANTFRHYVGTLRFFLIAFKSVTHFVERIAPFRL